MAVDSLLCFYDLTHDKELIRLATSTKMISEQQDLTEQEDVSTVAADYSQLYNRYLERQYRRDRASMQKNN